MATFLVELTVQTSGYEKSTQHLVEAGCKSLATDYALYCESHDPESLDWDDKRVVDMGYEFVYTVRSVTEVPAEHLDVLKHYMNVQHYCQLDLAKSGNYVPF